MFLEAAMPGPTPELGSQLVRAGAGAGKTAGLVKQVQSVHNEFIKGAGRAPRIIVTTFTRKATQELKERLILKACDDRDSDFLQFVSDPLKLHISTIHGLLSFFLKQTGHLADLDAGFGLMSESEARHMARLALRETLVLHPDGLKWIELYDFNRVLLMCREFDRKKRESGGLSPASLEDIKAAAAPKIEKAQVVLSEFAASILEENDNEEWVTYAQQLQQFVKQWPAADWDTRPKRPEKRSKIQKALSAWHERNDELCEPLDKLFSKPAWKESHWPKMAELWQQFSSFGEEFSNQLNQIKERQGRFEVDDLELLSAKILKEKPFLADVFSDSWDYWMIDEYQDTSPLQTECLAALIGERPKYLVGDPQQSIYLFRGADVGVFKEAEEQMPASGGSVLKLMRNYRSQPDLLNFINEFMQTVDSSFAPMETAEVKEPRTVCHILRAADDVSEMEAVAARVGELAAQGVNLQDICILGRAHNHLRDAAVVLKKYGFPTHVHASSGFGERREVLDAQALWQFLLNPHDTHNLVALLRSPWFFVPDSKLEEWAARKPNSLWALLQNEADVREEAVSRLEQAQELLRELGAVKAFEKILVEARYLDFALQDDPAGRKESNLWKLIDKARQLEGESTRSLLDLSAGELVMDPLEVMEGDATSAQEPNCINLMTIHGAKGLEFEHVIVVRMGKAQRAMSCADFSSDSGRFFFPLKDEDSGENAPSVLDLLELEKLRVRESAEFNRVLYVAATRARSTLTFTLAKAERDSWAARSSWFALRAGTQDHKEFKFEIADESPVPQIYRGTRGEAQDIRAPWTGAVAKVAADKRSVTSLIETTQKPKKYSGTLQRFEARGKGQRIHRKFEALKYRGEFGPTGDPDIDFVLGLKDPPMADLIKNGFVEWGFQVKTASGVIEGQIDAWGKFDNEIFVIDYKSGSPKHAEDAFQQLTTYAWALRKFGHKEKITLVVIYPLQQVVEKREFAEELFLLREGEFGLAQAAGQDNLGGALLDGGHGNVEGDLVGRAKPVHVGI
jgi:ATP-dependent helicase/nuclease subunit A